MSVRLTIIPDIHVPYHDPDRVAEVTADCRRSDHVVLLGDLLDAYPLMSHLKDPARKHSFDDELAAAEEIVTKIREAAGSARIDLVLGNHEDRLRRYMWANAPALVGDRMVRRIDEALNLKALDITMHQPSGFRAYNARFKHGDVVRNKAGYTARAEMDRHRLSGFSGHTHRMGSASHTDREGVRTEWWECGHLLMDGASDYVTAPDWQPGYVVATAKDGMIHRVEPVRL